MHPSISSPKLYLVIQLSVLGLFTSPAYAADTSQNQNSVQELPTITVNAEQQDTGFIKKNASTSTKLDLSVKETPQSVTVIGRQQIDEMGSTDIGQLLMNTTGVMLTGDNSSRTNFTIRGFGVGDGWNSNLMQYDGVPINVSNLSSSKPDTAMIESVEVLRGAAGLMQGTGEPSGAINLIRKKPTADFKANAALSYGSWNKSRAEFDISNRLNPSGSVRGRLVMAYQDTDSYIDTLTNDTSLIYGIVSADVTDQTLLNVGFSRQKEHAVTAMNLPRALDGSDLKLDRSTCSCGNGDFWDRTNTQKFIDLTHTFENGWQIKGSYIHANLNMDMIFTSLSQAKLEDNPTGYNAYLDKYGYKYKQTLDVFDVFAKGQFSLFGREHELVVGGNSQKSNNPGAWTSYDRILDNYGLDFYDGTAGKPLVVDTRYYHPSQIPKIAGRYDQDGGQSFDDSKQYGFYLTTRLNITDPMYVIAGMRYSNFEYASTYKSNVTGLFDPASADKYDANNIITPYLGVTYNITDRVTAYASYADTFVPQNIKDREGKFFDPVKGKSYETGIKVSFNDEKLIATLAAFKVDQVNRTYSIKGSEGQCPLSNSTGLCYSSAGKVISEGIETELRGEVIPNLNVSLGYTYNTTEYANDPVKKGRVFNEETPEHLLRAFASYRLPNQLLIGGGVNYQSEWKVGRYDAISAEQSGYALVNLMASYPINEHLTLSANVNNVLDKKYYSYLETSANRYGDPRNFILSLRAKF